MAEAESNKNSEKRYVKGLLLADTLGKGTFGYVKLGVKESTGQQFALKFLMKNNRRFKMASVKTEIDCMKKINHPNVIRLLHADYNCKYPNQAGKLDDTVLMVMEYAPGGDLYDILFYSGKLNER
jgi:serine/threonine protein kinase